MSAHHPPPSSAEIAMEGSSLLAGLGVITMALFPFALPGLLLALLLVLPLIPVALVAVAVLLLARILRPPLRFARGLVGRPRTESPQPAATAVEHARPRTTTSVPWRRPGRGVRLHRESRPTLRAGAR
jgi:hypothetical protein